MKIEITCDYCGDKTNARFAGEEFTPVEYEKLSNIQKTDEALSAGYEHIISIPYPWVTRWDHVENKWKLACSDCNMKTDLKNVGLVR